MKALPKLSKAQQEAWARILEWRSTYRLARSFRAGGTAGWRDNLETSVATSDATLKALTRKGLLISAGEKFGFNRYMVNPDYLPASEPAASEPATDARLIDSITEARLIESITEARIDRQRLENENASLTSQLEALKVRFAELEAERDALTARVEQLETDYR